MSDLIWPILGVLGSGALLWWFWRPRRRRPNKAAEQPQDLWKAMDDDADPTE